MLGDGVHERRVHDLHGVHDLIAFAQPGHILHAFEKGRGAAVGRRFVIDVVPGQLDDTDAQIVGELHGLFGQFAGLAAHRSVGAAEREASVRAQAHRPDRHVEPVGQLPQRLALRPAPPQARHAPVGLVDRNLHVVESQLARCRQPAFPRPFGRKRLFV